MIIGILNLRNMYFYIQLYRKYILFHCLWRVIRRKFVDCGSAKKSGVLTREVIYFSTGTETWKRLQKLVRKPGQKLVIFAWKWELRMDHYDAASSFKFRNERWNDMYQSAQGKTRNSEFPTCTCAHLWASHFSNFWPIQTWSLQTSDPGSQIFIE
jgi:hypothetical protein